MKYIGELREGEKTGDIYLCKHKQSALTKNGKPYENVILQDKTGTIDAKIWDPNSQGIEEFDAMDYVQVIGDVIQFAGALQVNVKRVRKAREGEYQEADYLPVSEKDADSMYQALTAYIPQIKNPWLKKILEHFFVEDEAFIQAFCGSSAAKSVHHGFVGGLLEHTLSVTRFCDYMAGAYPILNRDLLLTSAMCHDMGKTKELSPFPMNDYTDEGQLIGHIVLGSQMLSDAIAGIPDFPPKLKNELIHCILAHHGELEFGSPKKPAMVEAAALNLADNADAKMQTLTEIFHSPKQKDKTEWLGYNRLFETNIRRTGNYEE